MIRVSPPSKAGKKFPSPRSEEHTSELQSQSNLVCRLLLETKTAGASGTTTLNVTETNTTSGCSTAAAPNVVTIKPQPTTATVSPTTQVICLNGTSGA